MVSKLERNKDLLQEAVQNTAHRVGSIASIITTAVVDVTREIGDLVSDGFEMREAAKAAKRADQPVLVEAELIDEPEFDDRELR
ncbi:MAG: hypothetical protein WAW85_13380 [Gordonia sp. (in: high G+C Gram-positive bacteria)]|uniref:hypothetical protein n=1 Tax=Gordonia sp. (in: high G+C Gram-positive bacteria) TaxID=84139 RepID=UPI003BB67DF4